MEVLSRKVLILNADFRALTVCTVYKAFLLVYLKKAEIVNKAEGSLIRTVTRSFDVPSVIRLNDYVNIPYKGVMMTRKNIFRRDDYSCLYCGSKKDLTIDHVLPSSRGGKSSWTNLATACRSCNSKKGNRTPQEANMPLSTVPFKPSFIMFTRDFSGVGDNSWYPYLEVSKS